jgi:mediator of RNA polymerase II transcription subunit 6
MAGSQSQTASAPAQVTDPVASETDFSDALFMHSLNLTNAYGDEYMDENPLKGEPGAFVFEASRTAVNARNKAQEQAAQPAAAAAPLKIDTTPASVAPSVVATPKPTATATPTTAEGPSRKGSVAPSGKKKKDKDRRKSQGGLASPTTPSVP